MISPSVIEAALEAHFDILEERYPEVSMVCPYCGKGNNHCRFNVEKNAFRCFRCNESGNIYTLLNFIGIKDIDSLLISIEDDTPIKELRRIHSKELPDWTIGTIELDSESVIAKRGREYLSSRNVSLELARELQFRIGIEGRVDGTIVIPIIDNGKVQNYIARRFMYAGSRYSGPHKDEGFTPKGSLVYGINRISNSPVVIVEGVFDALALWSFGGVALMGKTASPAQIARVLTVASEATILLDREGTEAEVAKLIKSLYGLIPLKLAKMERGKDASEAPDEAIKAIRNAKEVDIEVF